MPASKWNEWNGPFPEMPTNILFKGVKNNIEPLIKSLKYKRLCWQLGAFLAAAVLFDIALIIWIIWIAS